MPIAMRYGSGNYGGNRNIGIQMSLLWTNPNPSSSFSAQTVSLDLSRYDAVMVVHRYGTSTSRLNSVIVPVGDTGMCFHAGNFSAATGYVMTRAFGTTTTGIDFNTSYRRALNSTSAASSSGDYCYPIYIFGIKGIT